MSDGYPDGCEQKHHDEKYNREAPQHCGDDMWIVAYDMATSGLVWLCQRCGKAVGYIEENDHASK